MTSHRGVRWRSLSARSELGAAAREGVAMLLEDVEAESACAFASAGNAANLLQSRSEPARRRYYFIPSEFSQEAARAAAVLRSVADVVDQFAVRAFLEVPSAKPVW